MKFLIYILFVLTFSTVTLRSKRFNRQRNTKQYKKAPQSSKLRKHYLVTVFKWNLHNLSLRRLTPIVGILTFTALNILLSDLLLPESISIYLNLLTTCIASKAVLYLERVQFKTFYISFAILGRLCNSRQKHLLSYIIIHFSTKECLEIKILEGFWGGCMTNIDLIQEKNPCEFFFRCILSMISQIAPMMICIINIIGSYSDFIPCCAKSCILFLLGSCFLTKCFYQNLQRYQKIQLSRWMNISRNLFQRDQKAKLDQIYRKWNSLQLKKHQFEQDMLDAERYKLERIFKQIVFETWKVPIVEKKFRRVFNTAQKSYNRDALLLRNLLRRFIVIRYDNRKLVWFAWVKIVRRRTALEWWDALYERESEGFFVREWKRTVDLKKGILCAVFRPFMRRVIFAFMILALKPKKMKKPVYSSLIEFDHGTLCFKMEESDVEIESKKRLSLEDSDDEGLRKFLEDMNN